MSRSLLTITTFAAMLLFALEGPAEGALQVRPHGLVYDTSTGATWFQDPMFIKQAPYLHTDGTMTWPNANFLVDNLVYAGYDDWSFSPMPYYPNAGPIYELYYMSLGNPDWNPDGSLPMNDGPFVNLEWTSYWIKPYPGSVQYFYFEFGGPHPGSTWNYDLEIEYNPTFNEHGVWPMRWGDVSATIPPDYDNTLKNGDFGVGGYSGWDVFGEGSVDIVNYPGSSNPAARMTTGSPVSMSQLLDTPAEDFFIAFDYDFMDSTGKIDVYLAGVPLDTVFGVHGALTHHTILVDEPALQGLTSAELEFRMYCLPDGPGIVGYIDSVDMAVVPEPMTLALLAAGIPLALRRRRK